MASGNAIDVVRHRAVLPDAKRAVCRTVPPGDYVFARLDHRVGALTPGLDADVVIWSGDPLDVQSRAEHVIIGGDTVYTWADGTGTTVERHTRFGA